MAICNCQLETAFVQKFIINYCQLVNSITLIWIPGHTGIRGNEHADEAAKAALSSTVSTMKCPASDFIPELNKHYRGVWQAEWDGCSANKLHSVEPHLGYCSVTHLSRCDAVILRRLCIGHTRVTHKYLLSGDSYLFIFFTVAIIALFYLLIIRSYNLILVMLYNFNYIFSSPTFNLNGTV